MKIISRTFFSCALLSLLGASFFSPRAYAKHAFTSEKEVSLFIAEFNPFAEQDIELRGSWEKWDHGSPILPPHWDRAISELSEDSRKDVKILVSEHFAHEHPTFLSQVTQILGERGVRPSQVIVVRDDAVVAFTPEQRVRGIRAANSLEERLEQLYVKPTRGDVARGLMIAPFVGAVSSYVWLTAGVEPLRAMGTVLAQSSYAFAQLAWLQSFDRVLSKKIGGKPGEQTSFGVEFLRRWGVYGVTASLFGVMGGSPPETIVTNILATGTGFGFASAVRRNVFHTNLPAGIYSETTRWIALNQFYAMMPFIILNLANVDLGTLVEVGNFKITTSTLTLLGAYGAWAMTLKMFKSAHVRFTEFQQRALDQTVGGFERVVAWFGGKPTSCETQMGTPLPRRLERR